MRRRVASLVGGVLLSALLILAAAVATGCARDEEETAPGPIVATIRVVDETYKIELATPELVDHARRLLAGEELATIPIGKIVRNAPSVNEPWSWHIDPATLEFTDLTTEVCDGLPEYVEDETLTSDFYCPWDATVTAVEQT